VDNSAAVTQRPGRSWALKLLVAGFLLLGWTGFLRLYLTLVDWQLLMVIGMRPGPLYLAAYGIVIGTAGLVVAAGLFFRQRWAPAAARVTAIVATAWFWLDRIFFTRSPGGWTNWPFSAGMSALCLLYVFLVLAAPAQRRFFGDE
jgi:hypothetical protein